MDVLLVNPWGNQPPRAVITSPEEDGVYHTDESVLFDGTDSWDPDDDTLSYMWLSNTTGILSEEVEFWAQLAEGKHYITLTVSDGVFESVESVNVTVVKQNTTTFLVYNYYQGGFDEIEASLTESGNNTQVWVDVRVSANARDYHQKFGGTIRPGERELFGYEGDRDGDGDVWLLITDIEGNVAGYFMPSDPNGADILYLDEAAGISVAAHEFNHMVMHNYNPGEYGWISEGEAQFAEVYFYDDPRVNTHMAYYESRTDTRLDWRHYSDDVFEVLAQYGVGFLFVYYFAAHYGGDETAGVLLRDGLSFDPAENNPTKTIAGVEQVLDLLDYDETFEEIYREWGVANLVDDMQWGDGEYGYPGMDVAVDVTEAHDTFPVSFAGNINPWASEYHLLSGATGEMEVEFAGDPMADYHIFLVGYADSRGGELLFIEEMELDLNRYGSYMVENMTTEVGELYVAVLSAEADGPTGYMLSAGLTSYNQAPVAEAGADLSANVGEYIHFDGTGSHDPDGDELAYVWDFDSMDGIGTDAEGPNPVHAYMSDGTYVVTLMVSDGKGLQANDTLEVTVRLNLPPVADAGADIEADLEELITLDGSASVDPDGDPLEYSWDTDGDGEEDTSGKTATWRWSEEGVFVVTLTVSDTWGGVSSDDLNVTVFHNEAPVVDAGPDILASVDKVVLLDGSGTYDPDADVIYFSWDFDATDGVDPDDPDATGPKPSHVFRTGGEFLVTLTVTDPYDSYGTDTLLVTVNTVPEAEFFWSSHRTYDDDTWDFLEGSGGNGSEPGTGGPAELPDDHEAGVAYTEEPVHFTGAPSYDADADELSYVWDFGDGEGSDDSSGQEDAETEHVYEEPGVYSVILLVDDGRGGNDTIEHSLQVAPRPVPPVPSIRGPSPGEEIRGAIVISGKCDDDGDVEDVEVAIDGGVWKSVSRDGDDFSRWTFNWDTDKEPEGQHTITARSIVYGEESEEARIDVVVSRPAADDGDGDGGEDEETYVSGGGSDEDDDGMLGLLTEGFLGLALWIWLALVLLLLVIVGVAMSSGGGKEEPAAPQGPPGHSTLPAPMGGEALRLAPGAPGTPRPSPAPGTVSTGRPGETAGKVKEDPGGSAEADEREAEVEDDEEFEDVEAGEDESDGKAIIFRDEQWEDLRELVGDSEIFQIQCPGCRHRFPVIKGQREVTCPRCDMSGDL